MRLPTDLIRPIVCRHGVLDRTTASAMAETCKAFRAVVRVIAEEYVESCKDSVAEGIAKCKVSPLKAFATEARLAVEVPALVHTLQARESEMQRDSIGDELDHEQAFAGFELVLRGEGAARLKADQLRRRTVAPLPLSRSESVALFKSVAAGLTHCPWLVAIFVAEARADFWTQVALLSHITLGYDTATATLALVQAMRNGNFQPDIAACVDLYDYQLWVARTALLPETHRHCKP